MNGLGQWVSNSAHVVAVFIFAAFELVCLAYGFYQISRGGAIAQATGQNALLLGWIGLFATVWFFLYYRTSILACGDANFFWSWCGWAVLCACGLLGAFLLLQWAKGHPSHVWPVLAKIFIQALLLSLIFFLIFKFWDFMGNKLLPDILGVHAAFAGWWSSRWLPLMMNGLLLVGLGVFAWAFCHAMKTSSYGIVSTQGVLALFGMALFLGPSWKYAQAREKWNADLKILLASGDKGPVNSVRQAEARYGTKEWNLITFHLLAQDRHGLALTFPGYLVGIEKANRYLIDVAKGPIGAFDTVAEKQKIGKYFGDRKRTFISHIVGYKQGSRGEMDVDAKFLHNLYASESARDYDGAYAKGFSALDSLRKAMIEDVDQAHRPYTHILAFCMGWNTDQQEAIRNYNSLRGFIDDEANQADTTFNPLFVGITWPSQWAGFLPLSYPVKADDADEIGLIWANYLVKKVLAPVKKAATGKSKTVKLALIGHSFGTRVLTRALASDPAWILPKEYWTEADRNDWESNGVDLFIGLQGAFGADRFVEKGVISGGGWEGAPYKEFPKMRTRFLFTWSKSDAANPLAAYVTGANHIGGRFGAYLGHDNPEIFRSLEYGKDFDPDTGWKEEIQGVPDTNKIMMLDVSKIVRDHPYAKGGGAHSDIYKPQIGNLLWQSISKLDCIPQKLNGQAVE